MNQKVLFTHIVALFFIILGLTDILYHNILFMIGMFALSGSVTNWIAIHMLFEKVPLFYGSGVIVLRFEAFKSAIHTMMMEQFFSRENIERFFANKENKKLKVDFDALIEKTDITPAFDALIASIMESSFGNMLSMVGGVTALEPLRNPFEKKMKSAFSAIVASDDFQDSLRESLHFGELHDDLLEKIDHVVSERLEELTPEMVKAIIKKMIHEHLGWLVMWGGFFGGLFGLVAGVVA
jgi:uncharacterized membrane protein YheB (UPF0754 family)